MEKTENKIFLTGIKPTGTPHIGNWLGAIRPALEAAASFEARYFIADYHALNSVKDPEELRRNTYAVAAAWMACGLNPEKTLFYRQSDIPQVFELATLLSAFTPKGLMNRAHAYKAAVASNIEKGEDPDSGVNMGLYTYPVLMAADILLFDADFVPVGKDQVQHIEIAVDIAEAVNRNYGKEIFRLPQPFVGETTQTVTGLDGRKMSKSYNNTIPLFVGEAQLKKTVMRIVTNSQSVDEPKDPDSCSVFALYKLFASPEEQDDLAQRYRAGGMGWGDAKKTLFEKMNEALTPIRNRYEELMKARSVRGKSHPKKWKKYAALSAFNRTRPPRTVVQKTGADKAPVLLFRGTVNGSGCRLRQSGRCECAAVRLLSAGGCL